MASIENLSNGEIRTKLAELGHPVGPVTETTRNVLLKKLKQLMSEKQAFNRRSKRLSKFSSGEESGSDAEQNGGRNSRKTSMPPPSLRSSGRKSIGKTIFSSSSSNQNNISSTSAISTPDFTPSYLRSDISGFSNTSGRFSPRTSTPSSSRSHYEFESGSDSDAIESKINSHKSGTHRSHRHSNYSSMSANSKKAADVLAAQFKSNNLINESNKSSSRPFFSQFAMKLSRLSSSFNPQDIKESDAEEDGPSKRFHNYMQRATTHRPSYQQLNTRGYKTTFNTKWKFWNNSQILSMVLLGVFVLFFLWLALAYFKITQKQPMLSGDNYSQSISQNYYPICKDDSEGDTPMVTCVRKDDLQFAVQLYRHLHSELLSRSVRSVCGPVNEDGSVTDSYMTTRQVIQFLMKTAVSEDVWKIENGVNNLKLLLLSNKHWGVTLLKSDSEWCGDIEELVKQDDLALPSDINNDVKFVVLHPPISWYCYIVKTLYKLFFFGTFITFGSILLYIGYLVVNNHRESLEKESTEVMELVDKILQFVSSYKDKSLTEVNGSPSNNSQPSGEMVREYVSVRHVHDTLIHPSQRQKMAGTWKKAEKFIEEHESRIRTEIQQVWGEDTPVWRWLGPPLSQTTLPFTPISQQQEAPSSTDNHLYPDLTGIRAENSKRVWQGEAFETCEGSINSLPNSVTQCLKIRHMFQLNKDYGSDWMIKVQDAIVEKCENVKILHISVDKDSREGCVYVKCASQKDAGLAFRRLHGSWFDGKLVTVKYLRLERYHERFPEAITATVPLKPSNDLRLSLQGTS